MTCKGKVDGQFDAAPVILVAFSNGHVICVNCEGEISNAQENNLRTRHGKADQEDELQILEEKRRPLT